jgi:hypothetical protein
LIRDMGGGAGGGMSACRLLPFTQM